MKLTIALTLGLANAFESTDDNTTGKERSVWAPTAVVFEEPKTCETNSDCTGGERFACVNYNWSYNNQIEGGRGCWDKSVCAANASYTMFDGR